MNSPQVHMIILPPWVSQQQPRRQNQNQKHVVFRAPLLLLLIPCWARSRGASAERRRADKCLPSPAPHQPASQAADNYGADRLYSKEGPTWLAGQQHKPTKLSSSGSAGYKMCLVRVSPVEHAAPHTQPHLCHILIKRGVYWKSGGKRSPPKTKMCDTPSHPPSR